MSSDALEQLRKLAEDYLAAHPDASIDDLNRHIGKRVDAYNRAPQGDLAGLSPEGVLRLLSANWNLQDSSIYLCRTVPAAELDASPMLAHALVLLASLAGPSGVKATDRGNLPRSVVLAVAPRMGLGDLLEETMRHRGRSLNEGDVPSLERLRHVLKMAGLIRIAHNRYYVTRKGEKLTQPGQEGELFALLVDTVFHKLNMAVWGHYMPVFPELQDTVYFSLRAVSRLAPGWHEVGAVAGGLVLPPVRDAIEAQVVHCTLADVIKGHLLRPVAELGLVELEERSWRSADGDKTDRVRRTPLFDLTFRFDL